MAGVQRGAGASSLAARNGPILGHAFLQAVMQRGFMLEADAKEMHKRICNITAETVTDEEYFHFVSDISTRLDFANFELRRLKFPGNGKEYIGFVNKEADEPSKMAARHRGRDGKPDIRMAAFFRALMDRIAFQEDASQGLGSITSREALNLTLIASTAAAADATQATQGEGGDEAGPSQPAAATNTQPVAALQPLRLAERESALASFVSDGWLAFHPTHSNAYILGPRACLELGPMLLSSEDLPDGTREALNKALGYA